MLPFPLNMMFGDDDQGEESPSLEIPPEGLLVVGAVTPTGLITTPIDINTPAWKAFEEVMLEMMKTRHPSEELIRQLAKRQEALRAELEPLFANLALQQAFQAHKPPTANEGHFHFLSPKRGMA